MWINGEIARQAFMVKCAHSIDGNVWRCTVGTIRLSAAQSVYPWNTGNYTTAVTKIKEDSLFWHSMAFNLHFIQFALLLIIFFLKVLVPHTNGNREVTVLGMSPVETSRGCSCPVKNQGFTET